MVLRSICFPMVSTFLTVALTASLTAEETHLSEGAVAKAVVTADRGGRNLIATDGWRPWGEGFDRQRLELVCDNGSDAKIHRGASQSVLLNQTHPEPIVATVSSRCEGVSGSANSNYSVYLDLSFIDGTHLWGQYAPFDTGTHGWQQRRVVVIPEKSVRQVTMHLLLREHAGKAMFREPVLRVVATPDGATRFDGVAVIPTSRAVAGFQVRDVADDGDFVRISRRALGLELACLRTEKGEATFFDVTLSNATGRDRAITLVYAIPVDAGGLRWLQNPRRDIAVAAGREYIHASRFLRAGANGRLSKYPFGAVASDRLGVALGIDMENPAFYRVSYHAATQELYLAYDLGLTKEKPSAHIRFCRYTFDPHEKFRGALAQYYELFPEAFRCRLPKQGLWMPFAKISDVQNWQDFGFKFKEGNNETLWDDQNGITTFRYTEPMTWWMRMPDRELRTLPSALAYARRLVDEKQDPRAQSLFTSGFRDADGQFVARMLDTPWCNGAVWSMNSMPGIAGDPTDFSVKWSADIERHHYGPDGRAKLDGEYVDSSEGYVTDELDFCRQHFAAATTPLCFCKHTHKPAIFRGLIAFEYIREIARDVHGKGRYMMANSTPIRLSWLAPNLDVLGTETNWNPNNRWRPMSDEDLLYRRVICKGKPYCFLMNTRFEEFSGELVEKYMKRALAYGMFPGFFSHNASQGHYFTRPDLYNRDRPLFKKYVPLCRLVAEAGWEPLTRATCDDQHVFLERFGDRYLTVFNDSDQRRTVTLRTDGLPKGTGRELVSGRRLEWKQNEVRLTLDAEDVAVVELN